MGKINAAWRVAMSTMGRNFTKAEHDAGWPESLKHGQLAALQYPYVKGEPAKIRLARDRAGDILSACKSGELLHTATTVTVTPPPLPIQRRNEFASSEWLNEFGRFGSLGARNGRITSQPTPQPHDVTTYTVTAQAFAAWLAAQKETPSEHIAAWFEAVGVNTQPEAPPVPTATPATVTTQTTKHRDLLAPLVEAAQKACDSATDAAAVFTKLKTWAQEDKPRAPLVGVTEDGRIQWRDSNDTPKELDKKALAKRLQRQQKTPATTPPGKQLRRIK